MSLRPSAVRGANAVVGSNVGGGENPRPRVRIAAGDASYDRTEPPPLNLRLRIREFQRQWSNIKEELPPQLTRKHIGMISIGGVIGTGLFLNSASAIHDGGPIGAFLGYLIMGSIVYCLCVSIGEMIAFLPNVGGVVGITDLYVDPALGFSMGWAAWYNWSVTLPAEITAAALVVGFWTGGTVPPRWSNAIIAMILTAVTSINLFSSNVYGEIEFWLSSIKVTTIIVIIISSFIIDLGAGKDGFIGLHNWHDPGPFSNSYLDIHGAKGRFLGFWAVIMQAAFSFFGSEVPGIAAGEVIDATRNVPRALRRVWIRITLFYLGGILCAGLLVPSNDPYLINTAQNGYSSPFVIAFNRAGAGWLSNIINATILLSASSAAASDIYIGSRFLFFLARRKHAPSFLSVLYRYPDPGDDQDSNDSDVDSDVASLLDPATESDEEHAAAPSLPQGPIHEHHESHDSDDIRAGYDSESWDHEAVHPLASKKKPYLVLPLASVLVTASIGLLGFCSGIRSANVAFQWLVSVAAVASLQSWTVMLFTYIRWHQGTVYAENKNKHALTPEAIEVLDQIKKIKENRHWAQPYLAYYAFTFCMIVLITNGWSVFIHNNWRIADITTDEPYEYDPSSVTAPVSTFLASYIPLPFFLLLTFGYKLIYQTEMVRLDQMTFSRENVPERLPEDPPTNAFDRLLARLI